MEVEAGAGTAPGCHLYQSNLMFHRFAVVTSILPFNYIETPTYIDPDQNATSFEACTVSGT